jgi:hypothetical protein
MIVAQYVQHLLSKWPYFVERTIRGRALPIYDDVIGHKRPRTVLRRLHGDLGQLAADLVQAGLVPREHIVCLDTRRRCLVLKGHHGLAVKTWLANRGF